MDNKSLVENHLYFLSSHRGKRETTPYAEYIHSDVPFFNIAVPLNEESIDTIPAEYLLYLYDFLPRKKELSGNIKKFINLAYMTLPSYKNDWGSNKEVVIKKVASIKEMEDFSFAQAKGFAKPEEDFADWHPWLHEKNIKNLNNDKHSFFVGYINDRPAATCLTVTHENIAGIYAVATVAEFRKLGVSTSMMKKAVEDAAAKKVRAIALQVDADSYAHNFYKDLGFEDAFRCEIMRKTKDE